MKRLIVLIAFAGLMAGCDSTQPTASISVSGSVTFNGAPVPGGQATIIDSFGQSVGSAAISNGRYSVSAEIAPDTCNPTAVTILARDAAGALIGLDNSDLGACADYEVDFAF